MDACASDACWRSARVASGRSFSGAVTGITYGVMAVGVGLIYRSSRIINLAIAEMGGLAAAILAFLVINHHVATGSPCRCASRSAPPSGR